MCSIPSALLRACVQVYDYQRIQISMSCRNPKKQLLCEPHCIKRIDFYCGWGCPFAAQQPLCVRCVGKGCQMICATAGAACGVWYRLEMYVLTAVVCVQGGHARRAVVTKAVLDLQG